MELGERFWSKVNKTESCWIWIAGKSNKYGNFNFNGKQYRVHRLMWESLYGPIPHGMVICHKCDNPPCCNPDHLFIGTQKDNIQDAARKGRIRNHMGCNGGSEFNPTRGENNGLAKLTEPDVKAIRELASQGHSSWVLAKQYGVDPSAIRQVVKRQTWKHVA